MSGKNLKFWSMLPEWFGPLIPWMKGLLMAGAGAAFGAMADALLGGASIWDPVGRAHIANVALIAACATVAGYLRPQPQGRKEWSEDERAAHKAKLVAQNRLP